MVYASELESYNEKREVFENFWFLNQYRSFVIRLIKRMIIRVETRVANLVTIR